MVKFESIPLPAHFPDAEVNPVLSLFQGTFLLVAPGLQQAVKGSVDYMWIPTQKIRFTGSIVGLRIEHFIQAFQSMEEIVLKIPEYTDCLAYLTHFSTSNINGEIEIEGQISDDLFYGNPGLRVKEIFFQVPNMPDLLGRNISMTSEAGGFSGWSGRINLECQDYYIILDKSHKFKEKQQNLERAGGYQLNYRGIIQPTTRSISYSEAKAVLNSLRIFLSFVRGAITSPLFIVGSSNDEKKWMYISSDHVDMYKSILPWTVLRSAEGIESMWPNFYLLVKEENDLNVLDYVIHWYVQAQQGNGFAEGSIVLLQNALELLYNWWIVETKNLNSGDNLPTARKIFELLAFFNIPSNIPHHFEDLLICHGKNGPGEGPLSVALIRNAIVHGNEEKRLKLKSISGKAMVQALRLYLFYVEIIILSILEYKGIYFNRLLGKKSTFVLPVSIDLK